MTLQHKPGGPPHKNGHRFDEVFIKVLNDEITPIQAKRELEMAPRTYYDYRKAYLKRHPELFAESTPDSHDKASDLTEPHKEQAIVPAEITNPREERIKEWENFFQKYLELLEEALVNIDTRSDLWTDVRVWVRKLKNLIIGMTRGLREEDLQSYAMSLEDLNVKINNYLIMAQKIKDATAGKYGRD